MKFILFRINDAKKNITKKIQLDKVNYINEVSISREILEKMELEPKGYIEKIKYLIRDKNIKKIILKSLESHDEKWYYIISKDMPKSKYLANKLQELLGYKLANINELDSNIFKYVDDYLTENKLLKKHEIKVLIVANANKNINISLICNLIKEYKSVNIYIKEGATSYLQKRIKEINIAEGTTIDFVSSERKVFKEYNVIYFIDDIKENFLRLRFNKKSLIIDNYFKEHDKYNSNYIFLSEYMKNEAVFVENLNELKRNYNCIDIAQAVCKMAKR